MAEDIVRSGNLLKYVTMTFMYEPEQNTQGTK